MCRRIVLAFLTCLAVGYVTSRAVSSDSWTQAENQRAMQECNLKNCTNGYCNIPYPDSCFHYIVCEKRKVMTATIRPCPFGTMRNDIGSDSTSTACPSAADVKCSIDPCFVNKGLHSYTTGNNANCKTFYRCIDQRSNPACCDSNMSYNTKTGQCESDNTCTANCPMSSGDSKCRDTAQTNVDDEDGNCKTYYNCAPNKPRTMCCRNGQGFNASSNQCEVDPFCNDVCPSRFEDPCSDATLQSYKNPLEKRCRVYSKCHKEGWSVAWCCPDLEAYNTTSNKCEPTKIDECKIEKCPPGHTTACPYSAVADDKYAYMHDNKKQMCGVGTIFDLAKCVCDYDPSQQAVAPTAGRSCEMAIDIDLPELANKGNVYATIQKLSPTGVAGTGRGQMSTTVWDGTHGVLIPYFASTAKRKFFLEFHLTMNGVRSGFPQILFSTCHDDRQAAKLEISLHGYTDDGGTISTVAKSISSGKLSNAVFNFQYKTGIAYRLVVYSNKAMMGMFLQPLDRSAPAVVEEKPFVGTIMVSRLGFTFSKCPYYEQRTGFVGKVDKIQFADCYADSMNPSMNAVRTPAVMTAAPTAAPTAPPTALPTAPPTAPPTEPPTAPPTAAPTAPPTAAPTEAPTAAPTETPTVQPAAP